MYLNILLTNASRPEILYVPLKTGGPLVQDRLNGAWHQIIQNAEKEMAQEILLKILLLKGALSTQADGIKIKIFRSVDA